MRHFRVPSFLATYRSTPQKLEISRLQTLFYQNPIYGQHPSPCLSFVSVAVQPLYNYSVSYERCPVRKNQITRVSKFLIGKKWLIYLSRITKVPLWGHATNLPAGPLYNGFTIDVWNVFLVCIVNVHWCRNSDEFLTTFTFGIRIAAAFPCPHWSQLQNKLRV